MLYETSKHFILVGYNTAETIYRVIKLDRNIIKPANLSEILFEDPIVYTKDSVTEMLHMVNEGNKATGGLTKRASGCGVVGFVKFLDCFYLHLIIKRQKVGYIRGHSIYTIKETELFPIKPLNKNSDSIFSKLWNKMNKIGKTRLEADELR